MSTFGESTPQRSSSLDLSSPPITPPHYNTLPSAHTSHPNVNEKLPKTSDKATIKRRKPKEGSENDAVNGEVKIKKPRVPRGQGPRAMKKKMEEAKKAAELAAASVAQSQPRPIGLGSPQSSGPLPGNHPFLSMQINSSQKGNQEAIPVSQSAYKQVQQNISRQESRSSSGQNYDPIRSSTIVRHLSPPATITSTPPKTSFHLDAARSPSISSLIDPPDTVRQPMTFQNTTKRPNGNAEPHASLETKRPRLTPPEVSFVAPTAQSKQESRHAHEDSSLRPHTNNYHVSKPLPIISSGGPAAQLNGSTSNRPTPTLSKGPSPTSNSPKPIVRKEAPALPAAGSGLLTGSMFGAVGNLVESDLTKAAPTVIIEVSLLGKEHHTINFTRLAEEKYGFDALNPRLAAQRDRLARVAAAGAALEKAQKSMSTPIIDEASEDLSNDEGDNSNVELNIIPGGRSGGEADKPARKKRVLKEDMYDIEDDFIDDTEQAWEEQAAVSKDGFFVYSGPLVPEGQEAKVERTTDAAPKRPARGGRGGRGGGAGRAGRSAASKEPKDEKEVKKRFRRSKEQIERDRKEAEEKRAQKERQTVLVSKPAAPFLAPEPVQMQFEAQTHSMSG